jgi:hypothetical protein
MTPFLNWHRATFSNFIGIYSFDVVLFLALPLPTRTADKCDHVPEKEGHFANPACQMANTAIMRAKIRLSQERVSQSKPMRPHSPNHTLCNALFRPFAG